MRIRVAVTVGLLLALQTGTAVGQVTGDRARLVFTINGAYIGNKGLWSVAEQPVAIDEFPTNLAITRGTSSTFGASLAGTYYPKDRWGLTGEAFLLGLGYDDICTVTSTGAVSQSVVEVCEDISRQERSAATASLAVGTIFRIASREFISPFLRAGIGALFTNQSSILTTGTDNSGGTLIIYNDDGGSRVRPALQLGLGATMVLSKGYHLRWEVRDNIVGIEEVTGASPNAGSIPPHETNYEHVWSVLIGLDVILERQPGRRY